MVFFVLNGLRLNEKINIVDLVHLSLVTVLASASLKS